MQRFGNDLNLADEDLARAPDHRTALRMLELGRGRYVLDYDAPIEAVRHEFPDMDITGTPIFKARGAFVVSKKHRDAGGVIVQMDDAYRTLIDDGAMEPLQSLKNDVDL